MPQSLFGHSLFVLLTPRSATKKRQQRKQILCASQPRYRDVSFRTHAHTRRCDRTAHVQFPLVPPPPRPARVMNSLEHIPAPREPNGKNKELKRNGPTRTVGYLDPIKVITAPASPPGDHALLSPRSGGSEYAPNTFTGVWDTTPFTTATKHSHTEHRCDLRYPSCSPSRKMPHATATTTNGSERQDGGDAKARRQEPTHWTPAARPARHVSPSRTISTAPCEGPSRPTKSHCPCGLHRRGK
ncbi:uncharacterized protein TEOVI_000158800 [Trypanosoma equiperdum]|uniref:Uncharacterized protein n=2 Tax=Trypanozoon TaxID=39700 RepID=Q385X3_TRYB2|nr:hypothetical protein Tb11.02.2020 [Trypanosoma brucei brucei TREU927]EAN79408.1 hypothetical protein Tb11.02.2020 [Trypanosoma brucei brucei TREU927]SCU70019.1 hypothetical protein, conserved [Trypanosoma equiperdum]